ncbi:hypothetical protein EMPS_01770 [Entomortierella parvispora]|uniref:RNI-like protein n=1 Tax=Entomortierella parvispora TaxID=205924 RepID=A0A9P3H3K4_9FUNG|nr:hypothetical protein EMPS_01770 [Entomortierella parvispora]
MASRHLQQIRLGTSIKKVQAEEVDGNFFVLMQDVLHYFKGAECLELDGAHYPFVRGPDFQRVEPLRVRYQENKILDVILNSDEHLKPMASAPIAIPSPQSTAPPTPSSSLTNSLVSPFSSPPASAPPFPNIRPLPTLKEDGEPDQNGEDKSGSDDQTPSGSTVSSTSLPFTDQEPIVPEESLSPQLLEEDQSQEDYKRGCNSSLDTSLSSAAPPSGAIPTVHTTLINSLTKESKEELNIEGPKTSIQEQHDFPFLTGGPQYSTSTYTPSTVYEPKALPRAPDQVGALTQEIHGHHTTQHYSPQHMSQQHQQHSHLAHYGPRTPPPRQDVSALSSQHLNYQSSTLQQQDQKLHQQQQQQQHWSPPQQQQQRSQSQQQQQFQQSQHQSSQQQQHGSVAPLILKRLDAKDAMVTAPISIPKAAPSLTQPIHVEHRLYPNTNDPHILDHEKRALRGFSPPTNQLSPPQDTHEFISEYQHRSMAEMDLQNDQLLNNSRLTQLEKKLKQQQDWTEIATQVQNKVQSVLTQNHELHEDPIPRLFLVLPPVDVDSKQDASSTAALNRRMSTLSTSSSIPPPSPTKNDHKQFRVYFLCECGQHTRPLQSSGLNHIHYVDHAGYELIRPKEFFEKYGAFIRSLSHLIRKGVNCGAVSIPPLLSSQGQSQLHPQDPASNYRAFAVGQELQRNAKLDARLAETIEYLDSRKNDSDLDTLGATLRSGVEFLDGTDIRQLLTYIRIPPQDTSSIGGLYRIVTSRGFAKWVCDGHYRSTVHQQNELVFQQEIGALGGQYDVKTGRAKIRLDSAQDAAQLYKIMGKAHNLHELDIGLKWAFNENDIQKFVQAVSESKIIVLSLDGCRQKSESSSGLINFGKKYDALYEVLFSSKIQSLTLVNIPSLLLKIASNHPVAASSTFSVRILQLENVGALDFSAPERSHFMNLNIRSSNSQNRSHSIMKTLLTSFHSLTSIIVPGMNIQDEGVMLLTEQNNLQKTLRRINLSNNGITPAGGKLLAACLAREKAIIHLDLGSNAIGDDALAMTLEAMGPKLTILNLESTGFADKAMKALEKLVVAFYSGPDPEPRLEFLNLANNGWTTSGIKSLGRTLVHLRLYKPTVATSNHKEEQSGHLDMSAGEAFLLVNSMIKTTQLAGVSDRPWVQNPDALVNYCALTATRESYEPPLLRAQDFIAINSRLKVLRLSDAGLSEGAAQYIISLLDWGVLNKLDLRRCVRLFKPNEMLTILSRLLIPAGHYLSDNSQTLLGVVPGRQNIPQAPAPYGVAGSPRSSLRFLHLNSTGVDDQTAWVLAQDLQSGGSSIERLDIGSNHLTHQGITMILNALCNNTSVQHLNLNQNFNAPHSIYPSSATASAQMTREALRRFFLMNKTLQVFYFISADIDVVAQGLCSNNTIRSLVFDRLEGSFRDVEAFGKALAMNHTLLRFKVADGRQGHFLQAHYGQHYGQHYGKHSGQNQNEQYVDPFRDFKQEAIKTVERGLLFNYTIIEFQWPEMFDPSQPWIERLNSILSRNIEKFKIEGGGEDGFGHSRDGSGSRKKDRGKMLTRGVSVMSTTSTLSNGSSSSSSSSLSMDLGFGTSTTHAQNGNGSNINIHSGFIPVSSPKGPGDGYSYSVYSNGSSESDPWTVSNSINGGGGRGDDRWLSQLELSLITLNAIRSPPLRDNPMSQTQQQPQQQPQQTPRSGNTSHIIQRIQQKKRQ